MRSYLFPVQCLIILCFTGVPAEAQQPNMDSCRLPDAVLDSLYIAETESKKGPDKVLHAEPLFIDLIRDLGARKGEKEWNIGLGMTDHQTYDSYTALVEYEFAPVNRLGLEVELPFTFYYPLAGRPAGENIPQGRLNSLKLAAQYSFYVSKKKSTSLALGYIHEFDLPAFRNYGKTRMLEGHVYNPFFIAAKRWGDQIHTLLYTGPVLKRSHAYQSTAWQINSSFHCMISGTRNFIGIEFNKERSSKDFDMTIRPQMRLGIADNLLLCSQNKVSSLR